MYFNFLHVLKSKMNFDLENMKMLHKTEGLVSIEVAELLLFCQKLLIKKYWK